MAWRCFKFLISFYDQLVNRNAYLQNSSFGRSVMSHFLRSSSNCSPPAALMKHTALSRYSGCRNKNTHEYTACLFICKVLQILEVRRCELEICRCPCLARGPYLIRQMRSNLFNGSGWPGKERWLFQRVGPELRS